MLLVYIDWKLVKLKFLRRVYFKQFAKMVRFIFMMSLEVAAQASKKLLDTPVLSRSLEAPKSDTSQSLNGSIRVRVTEALSTEL